MSRPTLKPLLALLIAIAAALVTQPMRAGVLNTLVITENSSTSLTALLNGITFLTVTPDAFNPDHWRIALNEVSGTNTISGNPQFWTEPDAAGFVNSVIFAPFSPNGLDISSDGLLPPRVTALADGTTDTTSFLLNGSPLYVTFHDLGDVATVPDTGTTASLFGLSLTGLAFLRRKLC